jgi:hypothetical protein
VTCQGGYGERSDNVELNASSIKGLWQEKFGSCESSKAGKVRLSCPLPDGRGPGEVISVEYIVLFLGHANERACLCPVETVLQSS